MIKMVQSNQLVPGDLFNEVKVPASYICVGNSRVLEVVGRHLKFKKSEINFECYSEVGVYSFKILLKLDQIQKISYSKNCNIILIKCNPEKLDKLFCRTKLNYFWICVDITTGIHNFVGLLNRLKAHYDEIIPRRSILNEISNEELELIKNHENIILKSKFDDFISDWPTAIDFNNKSKSKIKNNKSIKDSRSVIKFPKKRKIDDRNAFEDVVNGINKKSNDKTQEKRVIKSVKKEKEISCKKLLYKPNDNFSFEIIEDDLNCLRPKIYINDNIINFYMNYVFYDVMSNDQREASYIFNCFFNTCLIGNSVQQRTDTPEKRHNRVAKWTKNVDIFSKDFIILPVCEEQHWFLVIICFPWMSGLVDYDELMNTPENCKDEVVENQTEWALQTRMQRVEQIKSQRNINPSPCILIFDSMHTIGRVTKVKIIRDYLQSEWNCRHASEKGPLNFNKRSVRGYGPNVPRQPNNSDCGIFVLHYTEMFFKTPINDYSYAYFKTNLQNWFASTDVEQKRESIHKIIQDKCTLHQITCSQKSQETDEDDLIVKIENPS